MKKVTELVPQKLNELQSALPNMLSAVSISDFDRYVVGYPTDQNKLFCCVRFSEGSRTATEEKITLTVHLQLPSVTEPDAYKYIDVVNRYLVSSDYENIAFVMADNFQSLTIEVFYDVTLSIELDDCI